VGRIFESKAVRSVKGSASVRTTVPEPVSALMGLEVGDTISWEVEPGTGKISVSRKPPAKLSRTA
jgi:bifunctional DNA-binding transcriptional regulator/antitoxin component of YhaV-PrlF toxin-antitoxin module